MKKFHLKFKYLPPPGVRKKPLPQGVKLFPFLPLRLSFKGNKTPYIEGLLDSGSDGLLIPKQIADFLGLPDLGDANSSGVGGKFKGHQTQVELSIGRGGREIQFGLVMAYVPNQVQDIPLLVGRTPVFDEFQVIFEEFNNMFHLVPKEKSLK